MTRLNCCLAAVVLIAAGASAHAEEAAPRWVFGQIQSAAGIGGESTGWRLGEIDLEGDATRLKELDGKRVGVYGATSMKEWPERGAQPLLKADRILELEDEKSDLTIVGQVRLTDGAPQGTVRVGVVLRQEDHFPGPEDHFVVVGVDGQTRFTLTLPPIVGEGTGGAYRLVAWIDLDADGLLGRREPTSGLMGADDNLSFSFYNGWISMGFAGFGVKSPHECNLSIREAIPDPRWKFGRLSHVQGKDGDSPRWELRGGEHWPGWEVIEVDGETPQVLDGKRVGVFGSVEKDFWDVRPHMKAERMVELEEEGKDLVIQGRVEVGGKLADSKMTITIGVIVVEGAAPPKPVDHLVLWHAADDRSYTIRVPAVRNPKASYRLVAWFDNEANKLLGDGEPSTPLRGEDDLLTFSFDGETWRTNGRGGGPCTSPHVQDLKVTGE